jgi:hypothetical protein
MINRRRNYTLHFYLMAVLVTIAIGSVNYLGMEHRARLDLTGDKRFTLSEGTQKLLSNLTEPISVIYYVDAQPPTKRINLERDVRDKLEELSVSSAGKLLYRIERVANEDATDKAKELEKVGIRPTYDVLTSGTEDRTEARGFQGYFSSLEVRYGTADPKPINGIVNLVDKGDEEREHRVDTLEFDIAYAVLTMQHDTRRPTFDRLLRSLDKPVHMTLYVSEPMREDHKAMAEGVERAVSEILKLAPEKVMFQRVPLPARARQRQSYPWNNRVVDVQPFDGVSEFQIDENERLVRVDTLFYCALLIDLDINDERIYPIWTFSEARDANAARTLIENRIWEAVRPRTRLGFVIPPHDPRYGQRDPRQPPTNGHTSLMNFVMSALQYEAVWVDIRSQQRVPRDLAAIIILEANLLSERELYEVERYLAEGGNVIMMVQGWSADIDFSRVIEDNIRLKKSPMEPHFEDWAKHLGITFQQDLLLRPNARLQPYRFIQTDRGTSIELVPSTARLAPVLEPKDLAQGNVFTRGMTSLPLPLTIEETVDPARVESLGLKQMDLIRLKDDVYRFIPESPSNTMLPRRFNLLSDAEVERDPGVTPGDGIRAQRLGRDPLVATMLSGKFPSYWADEKLKIPGWDGDPQQQDAPAVDNPQPGNLLMMSTAATLNMDYLRGYPLNEIEPVIVERGITFYRNMAEAFIYGEDLVNLRARTGVSPRISGPVDGTVKTMWLLLCIAGVPVLLMLAAGGRSLMRAREREDYETSLGLREGETNRKDPS